MKKRSILFFTVFITALPFFGKAQSIISVAGVGTLGYTEETGGAANSAELNWPSSVAVDTAGNIYFADANNNVIRKVRNGIITTVAGTGYRAGSGYGDFAGDGSPATAARLWFPSGVALDRIGNLYIADNGNNCIRKVDTTGVIRTIAGTGGHGNFGYTGDGAAATAAQLNAPSRIAVDTFGNVYIADAGNSCIREVTIADGNINTIAGTGVTGYSGDGGPANAAQLNMPNDVAVDLAGNVYIADTYNNIVRKIDIATGNINPLAGTTISGFSGDGGPATAAYLFQPAGIAVDDSGNVYFSDLGNARVRMVNAHDTISTIAGTGVAGYNGDGRPAASAELHFPEGLAAKNNKDVYIADRGNFRVRKLTYSLEAVKTVGNPSASISLFPNPNDGSFTVTITTAIAEQVQLFITNAAGEKVAEQNIETNEPSAIAFHQPPGLYLLSVITAHGSINQQITVK